jgi:acyl carrier protein
MTAMSVATTGGTAKVSKQLPPNRAAIDQGLREVLIGVLGIDADTVGALTQDSGLFGSLPEIDSMAVAHLFTGIEDSFGFTVDDDDVDGEMLETYGSLLAFVERKLIEI